MVGSLREWRCAARMSEGVMKRVAWWENNRRLVDTAVVDSEAEKRCLGCKKEWVEQCDDWLETLMVEARLETDEESLQHHSQGGKCVHWPRNHYSDGTGLSGERVEACGEAGFGDRSSVVGYAEEAAADQRHPEH